MNSEGDMKDSELQTAKTLDEPLRRADPPSLWAGFDGRCAVISLFFFAVSISSSIAGLVCSAVAGASKIESTAAIAEAIHDLCMTISFFGWGAGCATPLLGAVAESRKNTPEIRGVLWIIGFLLSFVFWRLMCQQAMSLR